MIRLAYFCLSTEFSTIHAIPPRRNPSCAMSIDSQCPDLADARAEMNALLCDYARDEGRDGVNALRLLMALSGTLVETAFLFEHPDESLDGLIRKMAKRLLVIPSRADLNADYLPAAYVIDDVSELGRDVTRHILKRDFDEPHAFADMVLEVVFQNLLMIETIDIPRDESFRILCEFATRAMVLEVAAQELCDVLLDLKMGGSDWSLADCIGSLSGLSGYKVAVWYQNMSGPSFVRNRAQAQTFNSVVDVMTREAVRYGIPGGTDWRFGLPANDVPANPPTTLISGILPFCEGFFKAVRAFDPIFQATACAKAAGRMLAVASGGEMPELAPAIAKPLAMAAMSESYRSLVS